MPEGEWRYTYEVQLQGCIHALMSVYLDIGTGSSCGTTPYIGKTNNNRVVMLMVLADCRFIEVRLKVGFMV